MWALGLLTMALMLGGVAAAHADARATSSPSAVYVAQRPVAPPTTSKELQARFTWGWISGTVYLNRAETKRVSNPSGVAGAASGISRVLHGSAASLSSILMAWVNAERGLIATIASVATHAGRCVKIKIYGPFFAPGIYSGGYCT